MLLRQRWLAEHHVRGAPEVGRGVCDDHVPVLRDVSAAWECASRDALRRICVVTLHEKVFVPQQYGMYVIQQYVSLPHGNTLT